MDGEGRITFANPAAASLTGYRVDELLGKGAHGLLHHTRADGTPYPFEECPLYMAISGGVSQRIDDEVFWRSDGSSFPVEYVACPWAASMELLNEQS